MFCINSTVPYHSVDFSGRFWGDVLLMIVVCTSKGTDRYYTCMLKITSTDFHALVLVTTSISVKNQSKLQRKFFNTLRTGDADLRFYITTVQDRWRKSAFLTRACFPCTLHLIMQYIETVSEWFCWRMFIETWPHSELTFRHHASSI